MQHGRKRGTPRATPHRAATPEAPRRALVADDTRPRRVLVRRQRPFWPSIGWTLGGVVLPGLGLIRSGRRVWGWAMLIGALGLAIVLLVGGVLAPGLLIGQAFSPLTLNIAWVAMIVATLVWVASLVVTHLRLRPGRPSWWQRLVGALAVAVLSAVVAVPMLFGARAVQAQAGFVTDVFGKESGRSGQWGNAADPWADKPRVNVLILGGDSGKGRNEDLGARTDTVILATMDTKTGDTVLYQLPRQTANMPFPADSPVSRVFPYGFTGGSSQDPEFWLNAMYGKAPAITGPDILGHPVENLGAELMKLSVGEALGLPVDYYVMIDMDGFIEFIDAVGGVTVNVNEPVAMGGNTDKHLPPDRWLGPGPDQHLNGRDALWYARGRYGTTDYARGVRQRCVINAVVKQSDPATILTNYDKITDAGRKIIQTDVPSSDMSALMTLALRVKDAKMRSIAFTHGVDGFSTSHPNWDLVRKQVVDSLDPARTTATPSSAAPSSARPTSPRPGATRTTSPGASPSPSPAPGGVTNLDDACAYHPVQQPA